MVSQTKTTRRRLAFTILAVSVVMVLFVMRLVDIQVVRASELTAESLEKIEALSSIYGARGSIVDSKGAILATAVMRYNVTLSPKDAGDFERTVDGKEQTITVAQAAGEIGAIVGQPGPAVQAIITDALAKDKKSNNAFVAKAVNAEQLKALDALDIPWLYFTSNPGRVYPDGAVAGNLVGFVGENGKAQEGVEFMENSCLSGRDGSASYVKGADGVALPGTTVTDKTAKDGGDVVLTIDADLQYFVQQSLAAQAQAVGASWAVATVMEVKTGKLLAVADYPSVDPGNVSASPPGDRGSRAFQTPFEPGSTYKSLTAAALIDQGAADPNSQVIAPYRYRPSNGADINDSDRHGDLRLTLAGVLVESSNTGMSKLGEALPAKTRYSYFDKFHQTSKTEVGFPAESGGIMNDYQDWDNQTDYATMFGQGFSTTAIQGASLYQTIANGGVRMPVQLVEGCKNADGSFTKHKSGDGERVVSEAAARQTIDMLEMVDRESWVADNVEVPGYRVAMKTGTAQQSNGDGGYSKSYLVSMSGFAPAEAPEYVVSVNIADPVKMNSSMAVAPVFRNVMTQVLKSRGVQPSTTPAPSLPLEY